MNLAEALNAALPELPVKTVRRGVPRLDPQVVAREGVDEAGRQIFTVLSTATRSVYDLKGEEWALAQLFDGKRSYAEIAELYAQATGIDITEDNLRDFVADLEQLELWYHTPQERNIILSEKLAEQRHRHTWAHGDIAHLHFSAWDPNHYFDSVYPRLKWFYTGWWTGIALVFVAFMVFVFIDRWGEISRDTWSFYHFTQKGLLDILEFWLLFLVIGFIHESAHGLTCKHFGGEVHKMGFMLVYTLPCFFVDVIEAWVHAEKGGRLATIFAGIWVELQISAVATIFWWGTPPGSFVHELAYKVILMTGIAVAFVNMNPLLKLDGYYFLGELVSVPDLKERSTAYTSHWFQKHIFRLPVEVDYLPRKRRSLLVTYALLSGVYCYSLLYAFAMFGYHVFRSFSPDWAFVPALGLGWLLFRSRIKKLMRFMKTLYLDKRESLRMTSKRVRLAVGGAALVVLLVPWWHENVDARFITEGAQHAVLRAPVEGTVVEVFADEGQAVAAGSPLVRLTSLKLESEAAAAQSALASATARATQAQLQYANFGAAERERQKRSAVAGTLREQMAALEVRSPIAGEVVTPRVHDLLGSHLQAGTVIAEISQLSPLKVRLYVPEFRMRDVHPQQEVRLHFDSQFAGRTGQLAEISPVSSELPPGLAEAVEYQGIRPPQYYVGTVILPSDGLLKEGMTGTAKLRVSRRSIVSLGWRDVRDFLGRKVW